MPTGWISCPLGIGLVRFAPVNVMPLSLVMMIGVACEKPAWLMFSKK